MVVLSAHHRETRFGHKSGLVRKGLQSCLQTRTATLEANERIEGDVPVQITFSHRHRTPMPAHAATVWIFRRSRFTHYPSDYEINCSARSAYLLTASTTSRLRWR